VGADLIDISTAHTTAVKAILAATGYDVFVVEVTGDDKTRTYPYLVLYPTSGTATVDSLKPVSTLYAFGWQITAVGRDYTETATATDRARAVLVDARPTVAGRTCGVIAEVLSAQPIRQDPTAREPQTGRPLFYGIAQFAVTTTPA
jgi:FlaG/FlaF family flagellin (archaellin)